MVITQSQGSRPVAEGPAKSAIKGIIESNLAIRIAVETLVANSMEQGDNIEPHREKAILSVYKKNPLFKQAVDGSLRRL